MGTVVQVGYSSGGGGGGATLPINLTTDVTGALPNANQAAQTLAGDVTGTTAATVVAKVNGATAPAAGALTTGNVAYVSGASALSYGALNLAGGANYVTGVLPKANQGAQDLAGDVTGNTGAAVVAKVNGATVPAGGSLTTGNALRVTGAGALGYGALDLAGGANYVTGLLPIANLAAPDFAAQNVLTTGYLGLGATPRGSLGHIRFPNATVVMTARNAANSNDIHLFETTASNLLFVGTDSAQTAAKQAAAVYIGGSSGVNIMQGAATIIGVGSSFITLASGQRPLLGGTTSPLTLSVNTFAFASDANQTLSPVTQGLVKCTGTVTGTKTLTLPTVTGGVFWIWNATSAGALTVKTSGGTGPTIANAMTAWVMCDGTNYVRMSPDSAST